ncbi:MAG: ATP synthase F1 subunit epsilon [Pseudomonadota bacterium]
MTTGLTFSLVSPERELFAGEAQSVLVPGTEGFFEVGPGHSPVMATLSPGILVIQQAQGEERYFVRGGFADVTADGLTILAEVAVPVAELAGDKLADEKSHAEGILAANDASPEAVLAANRAVEALASI